MCGIAGIYAYHPDAHRIDRVFLRKIRDHMIRRGPDGEGEWYSEDGRVALGHRRLSVIDLSDRASQPMLSNNDGLVLSFNGEIYNYRELRTKLEAQGYLFSSDSDTEVILHLYAEMGESMLKELRGMFAIALWDNRKKAMILARDPFGIKPLYYEDDGYTVRLASQVKALLAVNGKSRDIEPAGVVGFLLLGSVPEPYTCYQGIHSVPAGSYIWLSETGLSIPVKYCSLPDIWVENNVNKELGKENNFNSILREALLDSIRHHQVADVPVGAFLSSGIDSSTLVSLMKEVKKDNAQAIQTITLSFAEFKATENDEGILANEIANQLGTQHVNRTITKDEFKINLPRILDAMDQPSIDGVNTWFVSKIAVEQGLKVAISGLGGDELFGGYPSFMDVPRWHRYLGPVERIATQSLSINRLIQKYLPPKTAALLNYSSSLSGAYFVRRGLFMPWEIPQIINKELAIAGLNKLNVIDYFNNLIGDLPNKNTYASIATLEASHYMRNQLLRDADWAGMDHSLEIRVPFVDIKLWMELAPYVQSFKPGASKLLMANCTVPPLSQKVINRKKTGFSVPMNNWLDLLPAGNISTKYVKQSQAGWHWSRRYAIHVLDSLNLKI